mmetsp:Transcript_67647/g.150993  ORF Transcript_67647/g.150993 Transcript_67647/m.150993 type:complete len:210 (-) Transcript_67647:103-732(-)
MCVDTIRWRVANTVRNTVDANPQPYSCTGYRTRVVSNGSALNLPARPRQSVCQAEARRSGRWDRIGRRPPKPWKACEGLPSSWIARKQIAGAATARSTHRAPCPVCRPRPYRGSQQRRTCRRQAHTASALEAAGGRSCSLAVEQPAEALGVASPGSAGPYHGLAAARAIVPAPALCCSLRQEPRQAVSPADPSLLTAPRTRGSGAAVEQ